MKVLLTTTLIGLFAASSLNAATIFSATNNTNLNDATNWSNGLPSGGNAGTISADGGMTANFGNANEILIINSSVTTGAFNMSITGGADRLFIGRGTAQTGSLTVNNGGALLAIGASQDVRLGTTGGFGSLFFEDGSSIDTRKEMRVFNGFLSFGSDVTTLQNGIQDEFEIGAASTLQFLVNGSFQNHTVQGSTVPMIFQSGSTLNLNFAATPTAGQSFKLVDDVQSYTGTFTNVTGTGLGAGQFLSVNYGLGATGLVVTVVPEPTTSGVLAAMALLFFGVRRRR